jgi:hypothetical protein
MSTKVKPVVPEKAVRNYIAGVLHEGAMLKFHGIGEAREVGFHEVWVWEERPTFTDPHFTKVTFHGRSHVSSGWARYEGKFGVWIVDITAEGSLSTADARKQPCTRIWGKPYCTHSSDEWCETQEQRKARLTALFEQYPMNERPNERWSWYKQA